MKQKEFDEKVDALSDQVAAIDKNLDSESTEINQNLSALRDEIKRLQESQGDSIDTSRLDEISSRLEQSAQRIGGLVDPLPSSESSTGNATDEQTPAQTSDEQPARSEEVGSEDDTQEFPAQLVDEQPAKSDESESSESGQESTEEGASENSSESNTDEDKK